MQKKSPIPIIDRIQRAIIQVRVDFAGDPSLTIHATHEAIMEIRTFAYKTGSLAFNVRTDKDPIHCEVFGYEIVPMYGSGIKIELHVQVCGNSPNTVICVC